MPSKEAGARMPHIGSFLRSINVQLDALEPGRIEHFRPTAKAATFLERLFVSGTPALLVTAPYGSGKSLTATYALQIVENRDDAKPTLRFLAEQVGRVSASTSEYALRRVRSKGRGLCIAIQGHAPDLRRALCDGFRAAADRHGLARLAAKQLRERVPSDASVPDTMHGLLEASSALGFDQVMLAWDEFGRHLESLIANGRPSELHDVQQLAEISARSRKFPFRIVVLLHQGFSAYASSAPDNVRREWKKIEERFERLEYVDDSKELLRLLIDITAAECPKPLTELSQKTRARQTKLLQEAGLFKEFSASEVAELLDRCQPLDPCTLYLLPRISARVAQNERTLFNFLQSIDLSQPVGCDALYRYFEPAMRQDVGVGGTYRAMLETNSAVAKCSSADEVTALQTACILSIGLSSNRTKISRQLLMLATQGAQADFAAATRVIDGLIERKLLLYRRHSDEVSVWHGTDANLRERIAECSRAGLGAVDLAAFLSKEWPMAAVRATEHNDRHRMRRFFDRQYRDPSAAEAEGFSSTLTGAPTIGDGAIIHFLPNATDAGLAIDIETAKAISRASSHAVIVSVPSEPVPLDAAARELNAIMQLQHDRTLLDSDPLVAEELRQLEDDTRSHMLKQLERVTTPGDGCIFFCNGKQVDVRSAADLRRLVSRCCDRLYPKTPILPNEQLNRRRPSAVVVNARKKLLGAILEASGRPDLGFHEAKFQQELGATVVAQYRAIVKNPGLYRQVTPDRWAFAHPSAIKDSGLSAIWQEFRTFFTEPCDQPKSFEVLLSRLSAPPYGIRPGVVPVLVACAVRAFPVVGSMTCDGQYVSDIRPSVIEDLCKEPARYALNVVAVEESQRAYLEGVCDLFRGRRTGSVDDPDLVRRAFEWIQYWKAEAPEAARVSSSVIPLAAEVRRALWSTEDPVRVLLQMVPHALGVRNGDLAEALSRLALAKDNLDSVVHVYASRALTAMCSAVGASERIGDDRAMLSSLQEWAEAIPPKALDEVSEPRAKGVVAQLHSTGSDPLRLVNTISARLTKSVMRWDDTELAKFQQEFRRVVDTVEESAFRLAGQGAEIGESARERLASLVESRIVTQVATLCAIAGNAEAAHRLKRLLPTAQGIGKHSNVQGLFHGQAD